MITQLTIRRPDDFHVHLRDGDMLKEVAPFTTWAFARALVMPNTEPPVLCANNVATYREEILRASSDFRFEPLMTIKLTHATTPEIVERARAAGAIAAKLYPVGVTTNSSDGVAMDRLDELDAVFEAMAVCGMVLCVHAEAPGVPVLDREHVFRLHLNRLLDRHLALRVVFEHVSTAAGVNWVSRQSDRVAATITAHHLLLTLDDVIGGTLQPHNFCKPVPKNDLDRRYLRQAVMSGSPQFFFGSDSAPHAVLRKERCGAAGVFSAPVALSLLAELFEAENALHRLEDFVSTLGARFYGLPLNEGTLKLERRPWKVPEMYAGSGVVPFLAGREMSWCVQR